MSKRIRLNKRWRSILSAVLVVAILVTVTAGIAAIFKNERKKISATEFERGSINMQTGVYEASKTSLYTKNPIPCVGLEVVPEFGANTKYRLFWYNMDDKYIGYSKEYSSETFASTSVPMDAWYARIVLTPDPLDENGKVVKDFEIAFYEVLGYANDVKISIDKAQDNSVHDIYANAPIYKLDGEYDVAATLTNLAKYNGYFILDNYTNKDLENPDTFVVAPNDNTHILIVDVRELAQICINNNDEYWVQLYAYSTELAADGTTVTTFTKTGYWRAESGDPMINEKVFNDSDIAVINFRGDPGLDVEIYKYMPRTIGQIG